MDQKKIGLFLKELRKEKKLTQEQLAEQFNISGRSVSRWETGTNLPDLSILVELADYYEVDVREIIDGERKNEIDAEMKETLNKVAEYADQNTLQLKKKIVNACTGSMLLLIFCAILHLTGGFGGFIEERSLGNVTAFTICLTIVILFVNILFYTDRLEKIYNWSRKLVQKK